MTFNKHLLILQQSYNLAVMEPIPLFTEWYTYELSHSKLSIPSACVLSTNGLDGYPNARTVSLKEVTGDGFIITGSIDSLKGKEIENNNAVAVTFWMAVTEKQVRIQGNAYPISEELANKYFNERDEDARLTAMIFEQGKQASSYTALQEQFKIAKVKYANSEIKLNKPKQWGGYLIKPIRMEFMEFKQDRLHHRQLYTIEKNEWIMQVLQP